MIRDFTEETEEALLDLMQQRTEALSSSGCNYDNMFYDVETLEGDYIAYLEDINMSISALCFNAETLAAYNDSKCNEVQTIFSEARFEDENYMNQACNDAQTVFDEYIETLDALINCINLEALGNSLEDIRYNLGRYGESYENSIFGDNELFLIRLEDVGSGLRGDFYDSIKPVDGDYTNLYNFLQGNTDDVELWQLDAVAMLLDECIKGDYPSIDYKQLERIVNGFYVPDSDNVHVFHPTVTYRASEMLNLVAMRYNYLTEIRRNEYVNINPVAAYADMNAIILSLNEFYSENLEVSYDEHGMAYPFELDICYESSNVITINYKHNYQQEHSFKENYTIYVYKAEDEVFKDISDAIEQQKENAKEDPGIAMIKKILASKRNSCKQKVIKGADQILDKVAGTGKSLGYLNLALVYWDYYSDAVEQNELIDEDIENQNYMQYMTDLHCGGSLAVYGNDILYMNLQVNENQTQIAVDYYNNVNKSDLKTEELVSDFYQFMDGEPCPILEDFHDFKEGRYSQAAKEMGCDYHQFNSEVEDYLKYVAHVSINEASIEQVIKATEEVSEKLGLK